VIPAIAIGNLEGIDLLPIVSGLWAAILSYLGWRWVSAEAMPIEIPKQKNLATFIQVINSFLVFLAASLSVFLLTTSREIAVSIGLLVMGIPFILARRSAEGKRRERDSKWPEAIDGIVSSLQAGQSVIEAIGEISRFGPNSLQPYFREMSNGLIQGESFLQVSERAMQRLDSAIADQVLVVLMFSKEFGGRDVTTTLRLLATFLRDNNHAREEVETRFGWVRNSAILGAVAPWLLLALLSMQPKTIEAYATDSGRVVLSIGIIATAIAFLWMGRVSQLPKTPRIYRSDALLTENIAYQEGDS
jgi:tight adherence protein B